VFASKTKKERVRRLMEMNASPSLIGSALSFETSFNPVGVMRSSFAACARPAISLSWRSEVAEDAISKPTASIVTLTAMTPPASGGVAE
jgi:hypothetical protein